MKKTISSMLLAAAACLAAAEFAPDEWEKMCEAARRRPRPIIAYNDADDLCETYKQSGEAMVEEFLSYRAKGITLAPVSTLFYTAFFNFIGNDIYTPGRKQLNEAGYDEIQLQLDYARKHNVEFFIDYRINDVHDDRDRPDKPHPLFTTFKRQHPEVLFGAWDKVPPFGSWSYLDFDAPIVREHALGEMREMVEKYDLDGLHIDFGREPSLFRTVGWGGIATQAQLDLMTELVKKTHDMLTEIGKKRGRPILLAVRVPDSIGYCRAVGIDIEKWLADGLVDILITGVNFRLNPWSCSAILAHKYQRPFIASVDYPEFRHINRLNSVITRHSTPGYSGRAAVALANGADGILYFNIMAAKWMERYIVPEDKLPHVEKLFHLTDRWLYLPDRHLKDGGRFSSFPLFHPFEPKSWTDTKPHRFVLEYDGGRYAAPGTLVYALAEGTVTPADGLGISSNGKAWQYLGRKGECLVYSIPEDALFLGANQVEFQLKPGAEAFLTDFAVKADPNTGNKKLSDLVDPERAPLKSIAYRAASGALPAEKWKSTYPAQNVRLIDAPEKLLHLDNTGRANTWQSFTWGDHGDVSALGGHVLVRCRVRMASAPKAPSTGFFCVAAHVLYQGRVHRAEFPFLADNRITTSVVKEFVKVDDVTKLRDYEFEVDARKGIAIVRQDGRDVGRLKLSVLKNATPTLVFGDADTRVEGAADVAYFEIRKLK